MSQEKYCNNKNNNFVISRPGGFKTRLEKFKDLIQKNNFTGLFKSYKYIFDKNSIYTIRLKKLEKILGFKIIHNLFFIEALTHRSYTHFYAKLEFKSNERLEFLGDSILNLIVGEYIYSLFKNEDEGFLTKIRSQYVNREILSDVARELNLHEILFLSDNAFSSIEKGANSIISDAVEAIIGAIYLDRGIGYAKKFVEQNIIKPNINLLNNDQDKNYKSKLLEFTQSQKMNGLCYHCIGEEGPEHSRTFTVELLINNEVYGSGSGKTKKQAEQEAALETLKKLNVL